MKICMFLLNNCKRDSRVLKEAKSLTDAGHDVKIIAVMDKESEPYEERDGFRIIRVDRNPIHYRTFTASRKTPVFLLPFLGIILMLRWVSRLFVFPFKQVRRSKKRPLSKLYRRIKQYYNIRLKALMAVFYRAFTLIDYYYRSWQVVKDEPADIYHSHDLTTLPAGYLAKKRTGGKLIYDSHEIFTELHYVRPVERVIFRFMERYLIRRADAVVTVNEFAAMELSKRYRVGLPTVVMNCPPKPIQGDKQCAISLRERLDLNDTVPIIVHIGLLSKARGSEKLISAVPFLNSGVVAFLGWGTEENDLKELTKQKGLENRVFFALPVEPDRVVEHISSASIGVVPLLNVSLNHYYATPNKLWECISAGLPLVTSNFPALSAIVDGYCLGKTCNPEDPEDIAAAINWVLSDKMRYEEMRKNVLKAARMFNWENESTKLMAIYRRMYYNRNNQSV